MPEHLGCDFCDCDRPAAWMYLAHDILLDPGHGSLGNWAACEECHALLQAGDRKGLLNHAEEALAKKWGVSRAVIDVEPAHAKYFEARIDKPPKKIDSQPRMLTEEEKRRLREKEREIDRNLE